MAKSKSSAATTTTQTKEENVIVRYFKDTRAELRKVSWPTPDEAKNLTLIIVAVTIAMSLFLGFFDYIFQVTVAGVITGDMLMLGLGAVLFVAGVAGFYFNGQQE